jgi:hypothetical protein
MAACVCLRDNFFWVDVFVDVFKEGIQLQKVMLMCSRGKGNRQETSLLPKACPLNYRLAFAR